MLVSNFILSLLLTATINPQNTCAGVLALNSSKAKYDYMPMALRLVAKKVEDSVARGGRPVVVFDLDDTLMMTRYRQVLLLRDFAQQPDVFVQFPRESATLLQVGLEHILWGVPKTLRAMGILNESFIGLAQKYWAENFFTSKYCQFDGEVAGASRYVRRLAQMGATIVYLTGRPETEMGEGSRRSLRNLRMPIKKRAFLMLKPDTKMDDLVFKKEAVERIHALGDVVGAFENEPGNANAFFESFPNATVVLIDTIHSDTAPSLQSGIYIARDFLGMGD